jgi:hypothetical protein
VSRLKDGDRIELLDMPEDPAPIAAGARGTVRNVVRHDLGGGPRDHVAVEWDRDGAGAGRSLSLVIPPDRVRVISRQQRMIFGTRWNW